ncbi:scruin like at the midline isoform X2 [Tachypleus tridentatus]|uniref:scruin like at the midline isoform X2 n=1 Tax=Tachypleus tridentatus TaxID=6853 RepID=UPI003FD13BDD
MEGKIQNRIYCFQPYKIKIKFPTTKTDERVRLQDSSCPKARSGHRIVADNSNMYCFGGYNPHVHREDEDLLDDPYWAESSPLFKELWKFNLTSKVWTKLHTKGNMPSQLASHAAVLIGNKLLVYGGTGVPFGSTSSNDLHVCDLSTLEWSHLKTTGTPPKPLYGQGVALYKEALYVVGGTSGYEYTMEIHKLDLHEKEWKLLPAKTTPESRYRHEIAVDDERIYVFGGGTATCSFDLEKIPAYNLKKEQWELLQTSSDSSAENGYPMPRRCHGCVQRGNEVYICGGINVYTILSDLWCLRLDLLKWKKLPTKLSTPVYFHSAALAPNGELLVFGGVTKITTKIVHNILNVMALERTNEVYSMWLPIPPLLEICWTALNFYFPHLKSLSVCQLREVGIPTNLINRTEPLT